MIVSGQRPGDLRMSTDPKRFAGAPVSVPAIRLSDLVQGPVDLLKLDVEGAEHDVMDEMVSSGALAHVGAIAMEYHHHIDPTVDRLSEMLRLLEDNGFRCRVEAKRSHRPLSLKSVGAFQDIALLAVRRSE